jgi:GYF domain 2
MNYFITRDGQQYGPYTVADLQRYVASGNILLTDLARSEGMSEPLPVSQIIGAMPVPQAQISAGPVINASMYPDPPNLHWGLVLLFSILTCGLFSAGWNLVQAAWMKKVAPQSTAFNYYVAAICVLTAVFFAGLEEVHTHSAHSIAGTMNLVYFVLTLIGRFSLRSSLEQHYNSVEPMGLSLGVIMTFFFGDIYFQYHLNEIMRRKYAGRLGSFSA